MDDDGDLSRQIVGEVRGREVLATRRQRVSELVEEGLRAMPAEDQERLVDLLDELNDLLAHGAGEELPAAGSR